MWQLATFDANQLSQYRRGACRYCWGFGHHYQWWDAVEFAQRLQQIEIERRQLEVEKLRKELAGDGEDDEPTPVVININVVDARADDGDQPDT